MLDGLDALLGPAVAGFLVSHVGWRWVFLSVPFIAVAAAAVAWRPCRRLQAVHRALPGTERAAPAGSVGRRAAAPATGAAGTIAVAAVAGAASCLLGAVGLGELVLRHAGSSLGGVEGIREA